MKPVRVVGIVLLVFTVVCVFHGMVADVPIAIGILLGTSACMIYYGELP